MDETSEPPALAYLALMTLFCGANGALLWIGAKKKRLPKHVSAADIALLGVATHRLTRMLSRDKVAVPLREPFVELEGSAGAGEVKEKPKGRGLRRAIGTLLCCQYCMGPWIASALSTAFSLRPRETRVLCAMLAMTTISDFTHQTYAFMRKASA